MQKRSEKVIRIQLTSRTNIKSASKQSQEFPSSYCSILKLHKMIICTSKNRNSNFHLLLRRHYYRDCFLVFYVIKIKDEANSRPEWTQRQNSGYVSYFEMLKANSSNRHESDMIRKGNKNGSKESMKVMKFKKHAVHLRTICQIRQHQKTYFPIFIII